MHEKDVNRTTIGPISKGAPDTLSPTTPSPQFCKQVQEVREPGLFNPVTPN